MKKDNDQSPYLASRALAAGQAEQDRLCVITAMKTNSENTRMGAARSGGQTVRRLLTQTGLWWADSCTKPPAHQLSSCRTVKASSRRRWTWDTCDLFTTMLMRPPATQQPETRLSEDGDSREREGLALRDSALALAHGGHPVGFIPLFNSASELLPG